MTYSPDHKDQPNCSNGTGIAAEAIADAFTSPCGIIMLSRLDGTEYSEAAEGRRDTCGQQVEGHNLHELGPRHQALGEHRNEGGQVSNCARDIGNSIALVSDVCQYFEKRSHVDWAYMAIVMVGASAPFIIISIVRKSSSSFGHQNTGLRQLQLLVLHEKIDIGTVP